MIGKKNEEKDERAHFTFWLYINLLPNASYVETIW